MELKGRHFDTTEMIEAESQAVLNALTEHNFQDKILRGLSPRLNYTYRVAATYRRS
jgi:hypothetical protein